MKIATGNIVILHMGTKNDDQMMYNSWEMALHGLTDRQTDGKSDI